MVRVLLFGQPGNMFLGTVAVLREQLSALGCHLHLVAVEPAGIHRRRTGLCSAGVPGVVHPLHNLCAVRDAAVAAQMVHDCGIGDCHVSFDCDQHREVPEEVRHDLFVKATRIESDPVCGD